MLDNFDIYIKTNTNLTDEDIKLMRSMAVDKKVRRKDLLLQPGEICRYKMFAISGLLRLYRTTDDGAEHIMQFAAENNWLTEPESLNSQEPTAYTIDALEDSELLMWTKRDFEHMFIAIPRLKAYSEQIIARSFSIARDRIFNTLSASPEEKYEAFIKTFPEVFPRIPLHMVASYLGVSLKTLTRVRQAQVKR